MSDFERALKKLVEDPHYCDQVIQNPARLTKDFKQLSAGEVLLLMQAWHASGDIRAEGILSMCHCCTSSGSSA